MGLIEIGSENTMQRFKKFSFFILLAALAIVLVRCGTENPLAPMRGANEVWIQASGFDPVELTITSGNSVKWTNKDANAQHDITSGTPGNPASAFPGSLPLGAEESHSATFRTRGRFPYYCTRHPSKLGTIVVQ